MPLSEDDFQKIKEICEDFLRQLKAGQNPELSDVVSQNPELAPELENRLELIEAVFLTAKSSAVPSDDDEDLDEESSEEDFQLAQTSIKAATSDAGESASPFYNRAQRMCCPHCGNVVQLVKRDSAEVTCRGCGSAITFDPSETATDLHRELPVQIGRFQVMRLLGEGAFGAVFLAFDPQLRRQVAVKVPRAGYFHSSSEEQRFYREAQSAAKLHHANIVPVYEISQDVKTPFIVSEYIDGVTMNDLASTGLLTFKEIAELMVKVCDAVGHAHSKGVIHRDLKPSNIMVDGQRNPWVADFGLARRDDAEITMTVDGMVLGTPAYMAPEQAAGIHEKVDARSDIYSLGVILYKLLARELPFSGTRRMLLHQVIHDDPKSPRKFNDNIPKDLETITLKALHKTQENRFQSAEEFRAELQRWLNGEAIRSRPTGAAVRFGKLCKRYPLVTGLSAAIAALLLVGTVFATYAAYRQGQLRLEAERNAEKVTDTLHATYQSNASAALSDNRLIESGYWYAKSLELKDRAVDRLRLQNIYQRSPRLQAAFPVESKVESISFSRNGRQIAIGTVEGKVSVYELSTRKLVFEASTANQFTAYQVEFLQQDRLLLFRYSMDESQIWDIENNKMICQLDLSAGMKNASIAPNSELLAIAGKDSEVEILEAATGDLVRKIEINGRVTFLAFPSTGSILVGSLDQERSKQLFQSFEVATGETSWSENFEAGTDAFLSRGGNRVATLYQRKVLKVWDTKSGKQIGSEFESATEIRKVWFPDRKSVSLLSNDRLVQTLDLSAEKVGVAAESLEFRPVSLLQAGNSKIVAANGLDGQIQFLDQGSWNEALSKIPEVGRQNAIEFSTDGSVVAAGGVDRVDVWDLASAIPDYFEFEHEGFVRDGRFSPDGKRCYTIGIDGKAKIWNTDDGKRVGEVMSHGNIITQCLLSPDGQRLFTGSFDMQAKVWDAMTGKQLGPSLPHRSPVAELAISPDGKFLLTGCLDGSCFCWSPTGADVEKPAPIYSVKHPNAVRGIEYASTGDFFVTVSYGGFVRIWDAKTGNPRGAIKTEAAALGCRLSPDASLVVVVWQDQTVSVWRTDDQSNVATFVLESDAKFVAFDANDRFRVSDHSGVTTVWQDGGNGFEQSMSFSHPSLSIHDHSDSALENGLIVSAGSSNVGKSGSGVAGVWSANDGQLVAPLLTHGARIWRARFSPQGQGLLTSCQDGTARLWKLDTNQSSNELASMFLAVHDLRGETEEGTEQEAIASKAAVLTDYPWLFEVSRTCKKRWEKLYSTDAAEGQADSQSTTSEK